MNVIYKINFVLFLSLENVCETKPCPETEVCHKTPDEPGYICDCKEGEKRKTASSPCVPAVSVDELCNQWGVCSQRCETLENGTSPGYRCLCYDGFFLEPDGFTCKPLGMLLLLCCPTTTTPHVCMRMCTRTHTPGFMLVRVWTCLCLFIHPICTSWKCVSLFNIYCKADLHSW